MNWTLSSVSGAFRFGPIDPAIPCGLIMDEVVANSLNYAFPAGTRFSVESGLGERA